jgi:hypothetical protein
MVFILNKTLVRTFYRQQAGFFLFVFLFFFGVVAPSMQVAYHYALIRGMLEGPVFMALVWLAWLAYALKVHRFVSAMLTSPECFFLQKLKTLPLGRVFACFLSIQALLLLPVSAYALIVAAVGWRQKAFATVLEMLLYVVLLIVLGALGYTWRLWHPEDGQGKLSGRAWRRVVPYWSILLRYLWVENKALLAGIKLFSCSMLYLMLRIQTPADYDCRMPYFVFSLALFGHGLLFYRCREMETMRMRWYRALPVPLIKRFAQPGMFCALLLLPEIATLAWLTPNPIRVTDSISFIFSAYSLLLLLYSLLCAVPFATGGYLKLCLVLFGILYACVLGGFLIVLSGFLMLAAMLLFLWGY